MSEEGEKTCPLCAEEMDLTDQQLKPCKCGYEICVWCWHHIMDMAEKDDSEGRCPACRSMYDKEKIVGMAASCERVVSEGNFEKKKSQKTKVKSSDGRKQLNSVRVIQKNLVYIVGLPLTLADEDLLQQSEYFGQYGKVLKVSMSRTASGVIQQFPNSTCSVYITYTKEEEAVRCIQSVHGFLLDGRVLKACFGTTKYCHAWLRNMPCTNPDCLYLHEVGLQEDSFTKDEIISAYTRNRVQQITGTMTNTLRRVGNVLPPPIDDYCAPVSEKPISRSSSQNLTITEKNSPPNETLGRSVGLPAAASWGMRSSSSVGQSLSIPPSKQKHDHSLQPSPISSPIPSPAMSSLLQNDRIKSPIINEDKVKKDPKHIKQHSNAEDFYLVKASSEIEGDSSEMLSSQFSSLSFKSMSRTNTLIIPSNPYSEDTDLNLPSELVSDRLNYANGCSATSSVHNVGEGSSSTDAGQFCSDRDPSVSSANGACHSTNQTSWGTATDAEAEEDVISFDNQRLKDPEVVTRPSYLPNSYGSFNSIPRPPLIGDPFAMDSTTSDLYSRRNPPNGYSHSNESSGRTMIQNNRNRSFDTGESSIISDILSLDVDPWDESLASPHNLVKYLTEPEKQPSIKLPNSRTSAQSRFSFARQDSTTSKQSFGVDPSRSNSFQSRGHHQDSYLDAYMNPSGFDDPTAFSSVPMNKPFQGLSRGQISAPPGFSAPARAPLPPPGFSSHDPSFDFLSGNSMHDMEFVDPAILAVGKGRLQGGFINASSQQYHPQFSVENDARLQMLMQRSRYVDESGGPDSYAASARFGENPRISQFSQVPRGVGSNQQWDGGNNIAQLLRNDRFGVNNFYGEFYSRGFDM